MRPKPLSKASAALLIVSATALALPSTAAAMDPFVNGSSALQDNTVTSGVAVGVADMNADGLDDIIRLDDARSLEIEYQQQDGTFLRTSFGTLGGGGSEWNLTIADVDRNGYNDIFSGGGYNGLKLLMANADGTDYTLIPLPGPNVFVQCANFADIDNNGTLDLFVCHDDGISSPYNNDGSGGFTYDLGLINAESTVPSDNSGNYGSVWTDYDGDGDLDMYLAKCRLNVGNPNDGRRINMLFENDGAGNYTDVAEARGLRPLAQSWSADFADIDNDGDQDAFLINHDMLPQLYENDGTGNFTDITTAAGMDAALTAYGFGIQAHFEDFDNDGFVDLLATGTSDAHVLFMNGGDRTFTAESAPFPSGGLGIHSAVVGDLNNDGYPDVMAAYATGFNGPSNNPDQLFINPASAGNNWSNVILTGTTSNITGVGAVVELHGSWGLQIREVRSGESYGLTNSATRHFGLGTADVIDRIVVKWPSGAEDTLTNPPINETMDVEEGCTTTFYRDADGDGEGDPNDSIEDCLEQEGFVDTSLDCDDADENNFEGNAEVCDGVDNDCDDEIDEGLADCNAGETGGATTTTGPGTSGGPGGESSDSDTAGMNDGGGDDGCGCTTGGSGPAAPLAFGLVVLVAARRRRR